MTSACASYVCELENDFFHLFLVELHVFGFVSDTSVRLKLFMLRLTISVFAKDVAFTSRQWIQ
jgi:hypothetical protein